MSGTATLVIPAEVAERMAAKLPACGNCRFMRRDSRGVDRECHFNPPQASFVPVPASPPRVGVELKVFSTFPIVTDTFWCAKHEPKLDA